MQGLKEIGDTVILIGPSRFRSKYINDFSELLNFIRSYRNKKIVFINAFEFEPLGDIDQGKHHKQLKKAVKNNNNYFEYWISRPDLKQYTRLKDTNTTLVSWPFYWAFRTYSKNNFDYYNYVNVNKDSLYVTMNGNPRPNRCMLIDGIYKHNMQDFGFISWVSPERVEGYKFSYFDNSLLSLDEYYNDKASQDNTPLQYVTSLIDIIGESADTDDKTMMSLTEKFFRAIIYKKPFLIVSNKGSHQELEKRGFKLFHDFFDYSFDDYKNMEDRIESILNQIKFYKDHDYTELAKKTRRKTEYNYQKLLSILNDKDYIPEEFWDYLPYIRNDEPLFDEIGNLFGYTGD